MIPFSPYFMYLMMMILFAYHGIPPEFVTKVYNDDYELANRLSYGYLKERFRGRP